MDRFSSLPKSEMLPNLVIQTDMKILRVHLKTPRILIM
jgi:hypothetical protein